MAGYSCLQSEERTKWLTLQSVALLLVFPMFCSRGVEERTLFPCRLSVNCILVPLQCMYQDVQLSEKPLHAE